MSVARVDLLEAGGEQFTVQGLQKLVDHLPANYPAQMTKPASQQLSSFEKLIYDGPSSITPAYMEIARIEPEHVGNGTTLRAFFKLDDYQLEALFTRSITGGLEYQLPHGSVGVAASSPRLSIDELALSIILDWMESLVPKAQAAGLDKRTGKIFGYHSVERWEPHTKATILDNFRRGTFKWNRR